MVRASIAGKTRRTRNTRASPPVHLLTKHGTQLQELQSTIPTIWGVCFSLKANPNTSKLGFCWMSRWLRHFLRHVKQQP